VLLQRAYEPDAFVEQSIWKIIMNLSLGKEKRKKLEEKNMTKEEIFEELKELVTDQLGVEDDEVTLEASIQDDLGADSLDLVDLAMEVEEKFGVKISDEDLENIKMIGDIVTYIDEKKD